MLNYLRDKWQTARLRAKYERLIQERVLDLIEVTGPRAVSEDPGEWQLLGGGKSSLGEGERTDARSRARQLAASNPHARNILRLLENYVVGPGLKLVHKPADGGESTNPLVQTADRLWLRFLDANQRHFSYREYARRTWRDGECFLRTYSTAHWPPAVRFVDPETIGPTREHPDSLGIITQPGDVESPVAYLLTDPATGDLLDEIPAEEISHTKIGVDSNEKRGVTIFTSLLDTLSCFEKWLETELLARKLQSSIVLWRKVQGPPSRAAALADSSQMSSFESLDGSVRRERFRPGTILTTSQGTELEYLQPNTNFVDAVPLGRLMLLSTAAGAGLPEFMLTSDASNGNFASTMVAEGPAVKLFESEQRFFAAEFTRLWRRVMAEAIAVGLLDADFFDRVKLEWTFPELVNRNRPRERTADARLVELNVLSRAEVARRDGADPQTMRREVEEEQTAAAVRLG